MKLIFSNRISADAEEIHMPEELLLEDFNSFSPSLLPKDLKRYEHFADKFR